MGSIADKLDYLNRTKSRFMKAMSDLGYEVTSATTLRQAVDYLVEEAVRKQAEDFDVSDLPEYWHEDMRDALVHTMMLGDDYVHHLVTTDNHYDINYKKSVTIQSLLWGTGLFSKVLNLGDLTDTHSAAQATNAIADYHDLYGDSLLFAIGNHDDFGSDESLLLPLIENNSALQGDVQHFDYYLDDDVNKIRYVVANTPKKRHNSNAVSYVQSAPAGYHAMILTHYPFYWYENDYWGTEDIRDPWDIVGDSGLLPTIIANNIPFIGVFSGHEHTDGFSSGYDLGLAYQTALCNDGYVNNAQPWPKTQGTDTEQAITILSVNTKTRDVQLYRIGRTCRFGRKWSYNYRRPDLPSRFLKGLFLTTGRSLATGTEQQFVYSEALPIWDNQGNQIDYFIINKSEADLYWLYEYLYSDSEYRTRPSYAVSQTIASKLSLVKVTHNSNAISTDKKYLLGIEIQNGNANPDDFEIATNLDDYDLGWDFDAVPWIDRIWWSNTIQYVDGYAGTKLVNVSPGKSYILSADSDLTCNEYCVVAAYKGGLLRRTISNIKTKLVQHQFTVPDDCSYILISGQNFSGNTNKVHMTEVTI